jgi:hypothetical protein
MDIVELEKRYHGELYGGDSYIIQYTYHVGSRQEYILYYWLVSMQQKRDTDAEWPRFNPWDGQNFVSHFLKNQPHMNKLYTASTMQSSHPYSVQQRLVNKHLENISHQFFAVDCSP